MNCGFAATEPTASDSKFRILCHSMFLFASGVVPGLASNLQDELPALRKVHRTFAIRSVIQLARWPPICLCLAAVNGDAWRCDEQMELQSVLSPLCCLNKV